MKGKSRADYWRDWYNNRGGKAKVKASIKRRQLESLGYWEETIDESSRFE
jgi:hypothetical protein